MKKREATEANINFGAELHESQEEVYYSPARFRVLDCGRKWGKSLLCKAEIMQGVTLSQRVAYMCPTNKMLSDMWRGVKTMLFPIISDKNEQEHRLEIANGASIDFWSLDNPDGPRPFEYDLAIIDEAALVPLRDIWYSVIRPTLMKRHGRALFASTPRGYDGFWMLYEMGQDANEPDWMSWKKPTWDNPHIDPKEIEEMRRVMPDNLFQEEIEAEFMSGSGAVFRRVDEAAIAVQQDTPIEGHTYVIGADLAKTTDFSVFTVIDVTTMSVCYIDRGNHVNYSLQKQRLVALAHRFRATMIVVEQNTNLAFMEELMETGLPISPFVTGGATKALIIEALAASFDHDRLLLLHKSHQHAQTMLNELHAFQMERLPSGMLRYSGPRDSHDDLVMSLALAYHGATYGAARWKPELIELTHQQAPALLTDLPFMHIELPEIPAEIAWPTAEYILQ